MLFDKNARLSARVFGHVLSYPLYDADCCPAAREYLAAGNVAGAMEEWQRLADLGSGSARCVLAYVHLMGAPSIPVDLEEARRIALSAVSGARGYANYLLGCIALKEKQPSEGLKFLVESSKAGFVPANTHLASITIRNASGAAKQNALKLLRRAAVAGHRPALLRLAGVYLSGQVGFAKTPVGLALLLPAFVTCFLSIKYQCFSIHCFQVMASNSRSLFNQQGIRRFDKTESVATGVATPGVSRSTIIRWTHAIAAITAAVVLVTQSSHISGHPSITSAPAIAGWALLAVWPYGVSYLVASAVNARRLISTLVQSMLLCLVTTLVCSAYLGHLLDWPLSVWVVVFLTVAQAFLLLMASGLGEQAAEQVEASDVPITPYRRTLAWSHVILGLVAAGSCLARPIVEHLDSSEYGFNVASYVLLATLPYLASALLSWQLVTASRWKPWAYVGILMIGTALAVVNNSGIWVLQPGLLGIWTVLIVQFIAFIFVAEWALDETEW
jgi:TPR repeat protein